MDQRDVRAATTARSVGDVLLATGFLAVLALPIGGRFLDAEADDSTRPEGRVPARLPARPRDSAALVRFPRAFEAWMEDGFGFRARLIRWHNLVKLYGFGTAPTERMVVGPDRWLFTTMNRALEGHRGAYALTEEELDVWMRVLASRRDWLAAHGAHYLFVLGPGKPSIYGDKLPAAIRRGERTPLDQLAEYLEQHSDLAVVDARRPLGEARAGDRPELDDWLYYRLGTHWTERGAHVAYREVAARLQAWFPTLEPWPESDFERLASTNQRDTMARQLRAEDLLLQGTVRMQPRREVRAAEEPLRPGTSVFEIPGSDLPRALVVHDSFGPALLPFLAEHFSRLRAESENTFRIEHVLKERPDVVIEVIAERRLAAPRPPASPLDQEGAERAFERASTVVAKIDGARAARDVEPWRRTGLVLGTDPGEPAFTVRCRQPTHGVLLPELDLPAGTAPVLRLDLESSADTELNLLYLTAGHPDYHLQSALRVPLAEGPNVVHLDLAATDVVGRLLLRFGRRPGTYAIRDIEVRASAPGPGDL